MKKTFSFLAQTLLFVSLFFVVGCDQNGGDGVIPGVNQAPTCSITNPQANAQFNFDESVPVTVVAEDSDGTIAEVQLYIDNVGHSLKTAFPYNFVINAGEMSVGTHILKAVAKDNSGAKAEASVSITINPPNTESPDFVTFPNGQIPNTWQTTAWVVDNTIGYDDIYSLKATAANVAVITSKTVNSNINCIEFYVRNGSVNFFIDGVKKECFADNNWTKYSLFLSEGLHTLKWESASAGVNIDAIQFKKVNFAVGMPYQGGIIAYVDNSGEHGLIAASSDQSDGIQWYNGSNIVTGTGTIIGAGQSNTQKIIQAQGSGNYAAKLCDDLVLNGYNDWFLPSKDELNELYKNRHLIGGFNIINGAYWSSSENFNNTAWCQDFIYGGQSGNGNLTYKTNAYRVRAVRAF